MLSNMNRRKFLKLTGAAVLATSVAGALGGCSGGGSSAPTPPSPEEEGIAQIILSLIHISLSGGIFETPCRIESITASEHMFISPILSVSSSSPSAQVSVLALILTDYPLKIKIFGPSFVDFLQRGDSYAIHGTHQGTAQRPRPQPDAGRAGYPCCPDHLFRLRKGQSAHPGRVPHPAGQILRRRYELYRCV